MKCSKTITSSNGVFGAPSGYMYIELQMDEELFEGGRTVRYPIRFQCGKHYYSMYLFNVLDNMIMHCCYHQDSRKLSKVSWKVLEVMK